MARRELQQRVISAIVLVPIALAAIWFGSVFFAVSVGLVCIVAAWELGRMLEARPLGLYVIVLVIAAIVPMVVFLLAGPEWGVAALALGAILAAIYDVVTRDMLGTCFLGALYVGLPALALVALRDTDSLGLIAVILVFVTVWATDIGAFFIGRRFGGAKLAPSISPGKTWSGAIGGVVAAILSGMALAGATDSGTVAGMGIVAAVLSLAAQVGDLAESMLKRHAGVKDSGTLIPGHGGVLDRVDGLFFACVVAYAIGAGRAGYMLPGQGLIVW